MSRDDALDLAKSICEEFCDTIIVDPENGSILLYIPRKFYAPICNRLGNLEFLEFFKQKYKDFTSFGGDMEILLFSTKIAHSLRIFGKNPKLRKKINLEDLQKGFEIFKETRKQKDEIPYGLYV